MASVVPNETIFRWDFPRLLPYLNAAQFQAATEGCLAVFWSGRRWKLQLRPEQQSALATAQRTGYLVIHGDSPALVDAWLLHCDLHAQPCIVVESRSLTARVTLQMGTAPRLLEHREVELLLNALLPLYHHRASPVTLKATAHGGTFSVPANAGEELGTRLGTMVRQWTGTASSLRTPPQFADYPETKRRRDLTGFVRGLPPTEQSLLDEKAA